MSKPSQERIERAAQVHREVCRLGFGIENRDETVAAILTADDSHLAAEVKRLTAEIKEMQMSFDMRWNADMRAIKMWQKETRKELTWPDHADLVVWLLSREERVMKLLGEAERLLLSAKDGTHDGWLPTAGRLAREIRAELSGENRGGE